MIVETLSLIIRGITMSLFASGSIMAFKRHYPSLGVFFFALFVQATRLFVLRAINVRWGSFGRFTPAEIKVWADFLQSPYFSIFSDILLLVSLVMFLHQYLHRYGVFEQTKERTT